MIKIFLTACAVFFSSILFAQKNDGLDAIKLYVSLYSIDKDNKSVLDSPQLERLFRKTQQMVNKNGVAELGFSNFLVSPKFDVLDVSVDQTGSLQTYLADCELNISIQRRSRNGNGGAVFDSYSKKYNGIGSTKKEAINNALNKISASDNGFITFLTGTQKKINELFKNKEYCQNLIKEAERAEKLEDRSMAVALLFSVPTNSPCYVEAREKSVGVWNELQTKICEQQLIELRALTTMAQSKTNADSSYYAKAMTLITTLSPTDKCYAEVRKLMDHLEKRFDARQKEEWALRKKLLQDDDYVKKARQKEMEKWQANYQPAELN